jgi:hypothetical protein
MCVCGFVTYSLLNCSFDCDETLGSHWGRARKGFCALLQWEGGGKTMVNFNIKNVTSIEINVLSKLALLIEKVIALENYETFWIHIEK